MNVDPYTSRSHLLNLESIAWDSIREHPMPSEAVRALRYMQDIECHTIVYVRELLATRAIDDPEIAAFLACWFYEESFHARALARFLVAAGHDPIARVRSRPSLARRLEERAIGIVSGIWPDFVAVHMTWGAINELTTLTGYQRLADLAGHPILAELLGRIVRDEARHFRFYYRQAEQRLASERTRRVTRFLVDHFWAPVGSGVQPAEEVQFLASYLMSDTAGRAAARKVDATIRRLPGFEHIRLLEAWIDAPATAAGRGFEVCAERTSHGC